MSIWPASTIASISAHDLTTTRMSSSSCASRARQRARNSADLEAIIKNWFAGFETREDAIAVLERERVPCAPVLTLNEAMRHPHLNERKTVRWIEDPILGKVAIPGLPVTRNLSLRAGARFGGVDLSVYGNNLTNAHPLMYAARDIYPLPLGAPTTDTLYFGRGVRPLTVGVTATYRY